MKKCSGLLSLAPFILLHFTATAQTAATIEGRNMVGIRLGSQDAVINNSITYKRFFSQAMAVEGLFSFGDPTALGVLIEKYTSLNAEGMSWFWGTGAYVGFGGGRRFGAQGVVGLDFVLPTLPINLSVDWKPELNFTRQFSFEPSAVGFSARFIF